MAASKYQSSEEACVGISIIADGGSPWPVFRLRDMADLQPGTVEAYRSVIEAAVNLLHAGMSPKVAVGFLRDVAERVRQGRAYGEAAFRSPEALVPSGLDRHDVDAQYLMRDDLIHVMSDGENLFCELCRGVNTPVPAGVQMLVQESDPSDFGICLPCAREAVRRMEEDDSKGERPEG